MIYNFKLRSDVISYYLFFSWYLFKIYSIWWFRKKITPKRLFGPSLNHLWLVNIMLVLCYLLKPWKISNDHASKQTELGCAVELLSLFRNVPSFTVIVSLRGVFISYNHAFHFNWINRWLKTRQVWSLSPIATYVVGLIQWELFDLDDIIKPPLECNYRYIL